jgi:hypothetical protein
VLARDWEVKGSSKGAWDNCACEVANLVRKSQIIRTKLDVGGEGDMATVAHVVGEVGSVQGSHAHLGLVSCRLETSM